MGQKLIDEETDGTPTPPLDVARALIGTPFSVTPISMTPDAFNAMIELCGDLKPRGDEELPSERQMAQLERAHDAMRTATEALMNFRRLL